MNFILHVSVAIAPERKGILEEIFIGFATKHIFWILTGTALQVRGGVGRWGGGGGGGIPVNTYNITRYILLNKTRNVYTVQGCPRPNPMTLGQRYHTLKGLDVGKCHTKFQLSSPDGIKVISCKRNADINADINLHLNLQVNLNLVTNVTYAYTHVWM